MIGCWIVQWQIWDYNWQSLIQISFMRLQIKVLSTRKHPRKQDTVFAFSYELSLHITGGMVVSPNIALSIVLQNLILLTKHSRRPKDFQWILLFASTKESEILFKQVSGVIQVAWPYQPTMMGLKVSLETCTQRCRKCREEKTSWL